MTAHSFMTARNNHWILDIPWVDAFLVKCVHLNVEILPKRAVKCTFELSDALEFDVLSHVNSVPPTSAFVIKRLDENKEIRKQIILENLVSLSCQKGFDYADGELGTIYCEAVFERMREEIVK